MTEEYIAHYSVLKQECLHYLSEKVPATFSEATFLDLTFGAGGHSFGLLERSANTKVIAFDQDSDAYENGLKQIAEKKVGDRIQLIRANFQSIDQHPIYQEHEGKIAGILLDLGVSTHHFFHSERGFSFKGEAAELDMRMDQDNEELLTAKEIVNGYSEKGLIEMFENLGEEKFAKRIARKIIESRDPSPINTTKELEHLVFHAYPPNLRHGKTHPATRVFQALRIEVNQELEVLTQVLEKLPKLLRQDGRLLVISFHSLEDRIVKHFFKQFCQVNENYQILTKKPIIPSPQEISENNRSRSAKLRILERKK